MRILELFVQLYIWDFSGQTPNFLLNDNNKNTKDFPRQPEQDVSVVFTKFQTLQYIYIINPSYTAIGKNTISTYLIMKLRFWYHGHKIILLKLVTMYDMHKTFKIVMTVKV